MESIQHYFDGSKGAFYFERDGERLAEVVYVMAGEAKMIIEHTDVDDTLRGQGVGLRLLQNLIEFVRTNGTKVIPLCPFANAMFKKHNDWHDLL